MARIKIRSLTLYTLLLALSYTPLTQASQQAHTPGLAQSYAASASKKSKEKTKQQASKTSKEKTKQPASKNSKAKPQTSKTRAQKNQTQQASLNTSKTRSTKKPLPAAKNSKLSPSANKKNLAKAGALAKARTVARTEKCTSKKGKKVACAIPQVKNQTLAQAHKVRVQKAQKTAMNKLMRQLGKPYRWGGTSPMTGFDCSGLIYYAYKDLVKIRIPRTANEMYHLEDAATVNRGELENGDLVFFRIQGRGTADHVGVYVGNGKFIQSPRSGRDIQLTSLSEDYWQRHYVGARRVMTPKNLR